jgi:single-strand DNA-binding protein
VSKGDALYVEGKISTNSWDDKDGNKHYSTEVICDNFLFLSQRNNGGNGEEDPEVKEKPASKEKSGLKV